MIEEVVLKPVEIDQAKSEYQKALDALSEKDNQFIENCPNLYNLLRASSNIEDTRLFQDREKPDQVDFYHLPSGAQVNPFKRCETTSWTLYGQHARLDRWNQMAEQVIALANQPNATKEDIHAIEAKLLAESRTELLGKMPDFLIKVSEKTGLDTQNLRVGTSGSAVIIDAWERTLKNLTPEEQKVDTLVWTSDENGSEVTTKFKQTQKLEEYSIRDGEARAKDPSKYLDSAIKALDKGAKFLSATLVSKTGERFDDQIRALAQVVADRNRELIASGGSPIILVVDGIQLLGRDNPKILGELQQLDGVAGIVVTGSKAPGGPPHAGFFFESNYSKTLNKQIPTPDLSQQLESMSLASTERIIGNIDAISTALDSDQLYGKTARLIRDKFETELMSYGIDLTDYKSENTPVSIIAFNVDASSKDVIKEQILIKLAQLNIIVGGDIHLGFGKGILRIGISPEMVAYASNNPDWKNQVNETVSHIANAMGKERINVIINNNRRSDG